MSTAALPIVDEEQALERALASYLDQYLCLIAASAIARHYVREQLQGGTWALRMDVLGLERWQEACQILQGTGMGGELVRQVRGLPEPWIVSEPERMVRALVGRAILAHGDLARIREAA